MGQFKHAVRRNVRMVYIVENNGVYGLTKGQFSATADEGQELKYAGLQRPAAHRHLHRGHRRRLRLRRPLLLRRSEAGARAAQGGAWHHRGTAVLDIISPCVAFNNHRHVDQELRLRQGARGAAARHRLGRRRRDEIMIEEYEPGEMRRWSRLHDGSHGAAAQAGGGLRSDGSAGRLHKLEWARQHGEIITGLIYFNPTATLAGGERSTCRQRRWRCCAGDRFGRRASMAKVMQLLGDRGTTGLGREPPNQAVPAPNSNGAGVTPVPIF